MNKKNIYEKFLGFVGNKAVEMTNKSTDKCFYILLFEPKLPSKVLDDLQKKVK